MSAVPTSFFSFCIVLGSVIANAAGGTIFVDDDATGANDGSSWSDAYTRLRDALAVAAAGDEIFVAAGTYRPDQGTGATAGDRAATFALPSGVRVYGGFAGFETSLAARTGLFDQTRLDGDLAGDDQPGFLNVGDNSRHVVTATAVDATTVLDGFRIASGNDDGPTAIGGAGLLITSGAMLRVELCRFESNRTTAFFPRGGGALVSSASSPTLVACSFVGNLGDNAVGGAVFISNGAPTIQSCLFEKNESVGGTVVGGSVGDGRGGAVYCVNASPHISDCTFRENRAYYYPAGGALFLFGATGAAVVEGCEFSANHATGPGGVNGGALQVNGSIDVLVDGCRFEANTAFGYGGPTFGGAISSTGRLTLRDCEFTANRVTDAPLGGHGGAVYSHSSDGTDALTVIRSRFLGNVADSVTGNAGLGGAIFVTRLFGTTAIHASIHHCSFRGNSATGVGDSAQGGAIYAAHTSGVQIHGCEFSGNRVTASGPSRNGGAIFNWGSTPLTVTSSTFAGNTAADAGGAVCFSASAAAGSFSNCVFWGNTDAGGAGELGQISFTGPAPMLASCIVQGWTGALGGNGNSGADPKLVDADGKDGVFGTDDDDLRLSGSSPAVDAGSNPLVGADTADLDGDQDVTEPVPFDLAGSPRFADVPAVADQGVGAAPIVDIGAYETPCSSGATAFGAGCPGSGGFVPAMAIDGCTVPGGALTLSITNALGGSTAIVFFGLAPASIPMGFGCDLLAAPLLPLTIALPLGGSGAGAGSVQVTAPLPLGTSQLDLAMQAFVPDPGTPPAFANSNGVRLEVD